MSVIYSNKYPKPFTINTDFGKFMARIVYDNSNDTDFFKINYQSLNGENKYHYVEVDTYTDNTEQNNPVLVHDYDINSVVWFDGDDTYKHRVNYNYVDGVLYQPNEETDIISEQKYLSFELYLRQGFNWNGIYGIHLSIKGNTSGDIYLSKMIKVSDFHISDSNILLYGQYWNEVNISKIITQNIVEEYSVNINVVRNVDISFLESNIGYIYNWVENFQPFIQEKEFPDFLYCDVVFDANNFLLITPQTRESKTLQNSIKNYFGYADNVIVPINIEYIITTRGENIVTHVIDEHKLKVSNAENVYSVVKVGLDFSEWLDLDNPDLTFVVDVEMIITVDNKTINRTVSINTNFSTDIISFNDRYVDPHPSNIHITENMEIVQQVIKKSVETKVVKIYQPVFIDYIKKDFVFARKYISFENLNQKAYMVLYYPDQEVIINTKITSDNRFYFDFTEVVPPSKDIKYEIYLLENEANIGDGLITIK